MLHHGPFRIFIMRITENEFNREMRYQLVMHFIRIMLLEKLISEDEFFHVEIRCRERYKPLIGILLSGKYLLRSSGRIDLFISAKGRKHRRDMLHYKINE